MFKEGAFGGTYFRDNHSVITENWQKNLQKEFDQLKNIDKNYYCSD